MVKYEDTLSGSKMQNHYIVIMIRALQWMPGALVVLITNLQLNFAYCAMVTSIVIARYCHVTKYSTVVVRWLRCKLLRTCVMYEYLLQSFSSVKDHPICICKYTFTLVTALNRLINVND